MILVYIGMFHLIFPVVMKAMIPFMKRLFSNDISVNQKLVYKVQLSVIVILITICVIVLILKEIYE